MRIFASAMRTVLIGLLFTRVLKLIPRSSESGELAVYGSHLSQGCKPFFHKVVSSADRFDSASACDIINYVPKSVQPNYFFRSVRLRWP